MKDDRPSRVYDALFKPQSIVIVGGSESLSKPGGKVLANIVDHDYHGTLWVVNPGGQVKGLPTFSSVSDLPDMPELGIIAIPAAFVAEALEGDKGRCHPFRRFRRERRKRKAGGRAPSCHCR